MRFLTDMSNRLIKKARLQAILHKTHTAWIEVVNVIKRRHIALECIYRLQQIIDAEPYWVSTDELGSGFDIRYTHITWMDTR